MTKVNDIGDLVTVLDSIDESQWPQVREALAAGGSGHAFAPGLDFGNPPEIPELAYDLAYDLFQEAVEILENQRMLRRVGRDLHANIEEALTRIRQAQRNIVTMKDLGDVEFLEGDGEAEQFLKDATRNLKAAQALKYTDETGDMK